LLRKSYKYYKDFSLFHHLGLNMYLDEYKRWLAADLEDADLKPELRKIEGNDEEIKDRFAVALKFGTAGLRGVLGAGTNRMNIYVVRQATQGLANWVKPRAQPDCRHQATTAAEERCLCQDPPPVFWPDQTAIERCASIDRPD